MGTKNEVTTVMTFKLELPAELTLNPHATTKYGKRGRVRWGALRHQQAMAKISYEETKPLRTRTTKISVEEANERLQARTPQDGPDYKSRTYYQKVVLFS